jgi:hypothetical protein
LFFGGAFEWRMIVHQGIVGVRANHVRLAGKDEDTQLIIGGQQWLVSDENRQKAEYETIAERF